jgi:D-glycero-beta-D-manno-heptose 1-phosphate adenylyltransferase
MYQKDSKIDDLSLLEGLPKPWVFTNGVFDVLHAGHVQYLQAAKALGASLIVALNTDASARRLGKGPGRPLNTLEDRQAVLAALGCVDAVLSFDADTPLELIGQLKPDFICKGGDYDMDALPESALVRSWGGQAVALPFVAGRSTTALVQRAVSINAASASDPAAFAPSPKPPYTAVIFTSVRRDVSADDGYAQMATRMGELAAQQSGYIGLESARGADGLGITVSYWETAEHAAAWKRVAEHVGAQTLGRERWYARYVTRVATVERAYAVGAVA